MPECSDSYHQGIYLIYDHECLLCRHTAKALRLKKAAGKLTTINARTDHMLVKIAIQKGYDLNEGILVKFNNRFYYSTDAIHFLAMLSSDSDWFNRINAKLFKYKFATTLIYPILKFARKILLILRRTPKIYTPGTQPIFQAIFGKYWGSMPELFKQRYNNHAYTKQCIQLTGKVNITTSRLFSLLSPLMRLVGALVPYSGKQVSVCVSCISKEDSPFIYMQRLFHYPKKKKPLKFNSRFLITKDNTVIELMRFGLGIKMNYSYQDTCIQLTHISYVWRIFGLNIPLPLSFILGRANGHEKLESPSCFSMMVKINHPLMGQIFRYSGSFTLENSP